MQKMQQTNIQMEQINKKTQQTIKEQTQLMQPMELKELTPLLATHAPSFTYRSVPTSPDVLVLFGHLLNPKESTFSFL